MAENPIQLVHDKNWDLLEASTDFAASVPEENRVKLYSFADVNTTPENIENNLFNFDYPIVRVISLGISAYPYSDSSTTSMEMQWAVQVFTNQKNLAKLAEVQWAVFCAMIDWETALKTLTWSGDTFVSSARLLKAEDAQGKKTNLCKEQGWSSLWTGYTHLYFDTSTLLSLGGT